MKHKSNFRSISRALTLITGCILALCAGAIHAAAITVVIEPSSAGSEPVLIDWTGEADADDTGVLIENLTDKEGEVSMELLPGLPDGLETPEGFKLLDNSLYVNSSLTAGGRRIRARMDYARFGRAGLREMGIRANTLRLMRADFKSARWIRAVRSIVDIGRAEIRYLGGRQPSYILGHHGFDEKNEFVWAIMDSSGEQYFAIAGLTAVPIPAAWLLFITGSGLLYITGRRRSKIE